LTPSYTIHVSKIINAPLRFVFNWCTDFSEDDNKITGSKTRRIILQKTKQRAVYISAYRSSGRSRYGVNIVTLRPPRAWHLDYAGQEDDEIGDYRLTRLGPRRTRLDMTFRERYKITDAPTREENMKGTSEMWDLYVAVLERDYAHRK
jgi:hypothetical protein